MGKIARLVSVASMSGNWIANMCKSISQILQSCSQESITNVQLGSEMLADMDNVLWAARAGIGAQRP